MMEVNPSFIDQTRIERKALGIIKQQKKLTKKIEFKVHALNLVVTLLVAVLSIAFMYPKSNAKYIVFVLLPTLLISTSFILLYSVCRMRSTIKSITYAKPNEKLMLVHLVNFVVWCILVTVQVSLNSEDRHI